jgi:hypothetical protein
MKHISNCHVNDVEKAIALLHAERSGRVISVGDPKTALAGAAALLKSKGLVGLYEQTPGPADA